MVAQQARGPCALFCCGVLRLGLVSLVASWARQHTSCAVPCLCAEHPPRRIHL